VRWKANVRRIWSGAGPRGIGKRILDVNIGAAQHWTRINIDTASGSVRAHGRAQACTLIGTIGERARMSARTGACLFMACTG